MSEFLWQWGTLFNYQTLCKKKTALSVFLDTENLPQIGLFRDGKMDK